MLVFGPTWRGLMTSNERSGVVRIVILLMTIGVLAVPALTSAQSIAGLVRDESGALLPGVTVEATSPVLIERARVAVTDSRGQYQIIDLRPGVYVISFSLTGFTTVRRQTVEVSGSGVTTVNADLRVGSLQETVTVTSDTPIVDVQTSTSREVVL